MRKKSRIRAGLTRRARSIFKAALAEVDPDSLIRKAVSRSGEMLSVCGRTFDLGSFENIYLIAFGKAAPFMAKSVLRILGRRLSQGIVVCGQGHGLFDQRVLCLPAAHPLPDDKSMRAAREILGLAGQAGPKDLIFVLISGGGSAQLCLPLRPAKLAEKRWVTRELLRAGASITQLNTVRKHLSAIKGGRLASAAYPAKIVNLVISDVIGNDLEDIASGPTYWDSTTYEDAVWVLKKYNLWTMAPLSLKKTLLAGVRGKEEETLKKGEHIFKNVTSFIIGDNLCALKAAARKARRLGFYPVILTSSDSGEAAEAARSYVFLLEGILRARKSSRKPLCLLAGGELTVAVKGRGKGGRNTEFALAALIELGKKLPVLVASLGSDGIDGPTDAAGAMVTPAIAAKAEKLGLDPKKYLENNDSYNFFRKAGGLIITGPTRTNVMDLRLFLI